MPHFCMDEFRVIMMALPLVGVLYQCWCGWRAK